MSIKTPLNRVLGLGSAKDGVEHWWSQRISSLALIPLTVLFVIPFAGVVGDGYEAMRAIYADPFNAIIAILFVGVACWHLVQGLQVVIEDYIEGAMRTALLIANTLFCGLLGVAGVFSIAKVAFGA